MGTAERIRSELTLAERLPTAKELPTDMLLPYEPEKSNCENVEI
jgi:hypothetical protein